MMKFSIIVPVYNVENYISQCLESILLQSYQNFEVIIINDGSTDESFKICNEYSENFNKIRLINKKNGGLSEARNTGIKEAEGEYIVFIDGDDYIEPKCLEIFAEELELRKNTDILITQLKKFYDDRETKYLDQHLPISLFKKGNKEEVLDWIFSKSNNAWPSVRYIVSRRFIQLNDIKFAAGFLHEDIDWTTQIFLHAENFTCSEYYWYNHRMGRKGSITSTINSKRTVDIIKLAAKNIRSANINDNHIGSKSIILKRIVKSLFYSLDNYQLYTSEDKKKIILLLKENQFIFKYTSKLEHKLFMRFCNIFGFHLGLFFFGLSKKVKSIKKQNLYSH